MTDKCTKTNCIGGSVRINTPVIQVELHGEHCKKNPCKDKNRSI